MAQGVSAVRERVMRPWLLVLVGGAVLWLGVRTALLDTGNINLVPSLIVLGASLGPVVFVMYVYERAQDVPWPLLLVCFIAGGVLGVTAASVLEYRTLLGLGGLPTIAIGLIEETCKLLVPLAILVAGRFRREADGLLFGVASGLGFAAFESMGYGLTMLILSQGRITDVEQLLIARTLLSPLGHGAWTGIVCAMLWRARIRGGAAAWLAVAAAFLTAVTLHALWDGSTAQWETAAIALVSYSLLAWRISAADRAPDAPEHQREMSARRGPRPLTGSSGQL
jgi:RsiW-degrading membrane proteinase PrsW (M82 family)